ncbi:MAG: DNA-directed RNA polymerase subunit D [Candidatus Atabeyarchaeum deiterrae]|jgi:DNA-directed RNA polymerase subunit D
MEIEILEKDNVHMKFLLRGVRASLANALRRIMISEVPSLAIEDVIIVENTSPMYDEVLAHRLGLIPIKTDLKMFSKPEECECKGTGCPRCQVVFTLDKKAVDGPVTVYSGDLKSQVPQVEPSTPRIPLVKLSRGQHVVLEAYARLGTGKEHMKWQASIASYKYLPILELNKEKCEKCGDCVEACPRNIIQMKGDTIEFVNELSCSLCRTCEEVCRYDSVKVRWDETTFIFYVESTGAIPPEKIVEHASQMLLSKSQELVKQLEEAKATIAVQR